MTPDDFLRSITPGMKQPENLGLVSFAGTLLTLSFSLSVGKVGKDLWRCVINTLGQFINIIWMQAIGFSQILKGDSSYVN